MKRIAIGIFVFLVVFFTTLVVKFPYTRLLTSICSTLGRENKIFITWSKCNDSFPTLKLQDVRIVSGTTEVASFDRVDVRLHMGSLTFSGKKESCLIKGKIKAPLVQYNITNMAIPEQFRKGLGKGTVNTSGEFDFKGKKGKGTFEATISEFPNPLVTGTVTIAGESRMEPDKTDFSFNLKGNNLEGKGTFTLTQRDPSMAPQVGGLLDLKVGTMPVMLTISGDINTMSISPVSR